MMSIRCPMCGSILTGESKWDMTLYIGEFDEDDEKLTKGWNCPDCHHFWSARDLIVGLYGCGCCGGDTHGKTCRHERPFGSIRQPCNYASFDPLKETFVCIAEGRTDGNCGARLPESNKIVGDDVVRYRVMEFYRHGKAVSPSKKALMGYYHEIIDGVSTGDDTEKMVEANPSGLIVVTKKKSKRGL